MRLRRSKVSGSHRGRSRSRTRPTHRRPRHRRRVVKHRTLLLAGRTRIHLDRVQDLGEFLELEVVLRDGEEAGDGVAEARMLMQRLGIRPDQLIECAYLDLLASRRAAD